MKTAIKLSPVNIESRKKLDIKPGYIVRVFSKIEEKGKTRLQAFEGMVLARRHGNEIGATFTVRKVSNGVGVERIFPVFSPLIDKIEVVRKNKVRRAKLYYIRDKATKEIRKKMKTLSMNDVGENEEIVEATEEEVLREEVKGDDLNLESENTVEVEEESK